MKDASRLGLMTPPLLQFMGDVVTWCLEKQLEVCVTETVSTLEEDKELERVSTTHLESRAFDLSVRGWNREQIEECVRVFSMKYRHMGAVGGDGNPRPVYYHNAGTGYHLHFQLHRRYAIQKTKE